jgi:hypothetical protein
MIPSTVSMRDKPESQDQIQIRENPWFNKPVWAHSVTVRTKMKQY